jgi:hypothetical protein
VLGLSTGLTHTRLQSEEKKKRQERKKRRKEKETLLSKNRTRDPPDPKRMLYTIGPSRKQRTEVTAVTLDSQHANSLKQNLIHK